MAPRSGGEQFYPGPSPASPSPATRAPNRLQRRERRSTASIDEERRGKTETGEGRGGDKRGRGRRREGGCRRVKKKDWKVCLGDTEMF